MKYLFTILLLAFMNTFSVAQKFSVSFDAQLSLPQEDYKNENADAGFGLRANVLYNPDKTLPIKLGLELGMQVKGRAIQYFSGYINGFYDASPPPPPPP